MVNPKTIGRKSRNSGLLKSMVFWTAFYPFITEQDFRESDLSITIQVIGIIEE